MSGRIQSFDWAEIHRQLEHRLSHLGSTIENDAARLQALLHERTAQLAAAPRRLEKPDQLVRALVVRVADERYALPMTCAQEVTKMPDVAIVPETGPEVLGVINWRGEFVMTFDLALLLGLAPGAGERVAIILRGEEPRAALAIDGVEQMAELDLSQLQPKEPLRLQHPEYFRGATGDALAVIDEDSLLARLRRELEAA